MGILWKKYLLEFLLGMFIITVPLSLSLHLLYGDNIMQSSISILGFKVYHSCYNNNVFVWSLLVRIIPILLFSIWFLTIKDWWRYFIFCPLLPFASTIQVPFTLENDSFTQHAVSFSLVILVLLIIDNKHYFQFTSYIQLNQNIFGSAKIRGLYYNTRYFLKISESSQKPDGGIDRIRKLEYIKELLNSSINDSDYKQKLSVGKTSIIILLLIIFSSLAWLHVFIPKEQGKLNLLFLSISNNGFPDLSTFVWYITTKFCVIITLCIWIITSRNWWRYAILSPIIFYIYQLWEAFQIGSTALNENEYLKGLPLITILVGILFYLAETIKYQTRISEMYQKICNEIEILLDQSKEVSDFRIQNNLRYHRIKKHKSSIENQPQHLNRLMKFKKELLIKLNGKDCNLT